jgi:hypothetical protein
MWNICNIQITHLQHVSEKQIKHREQKTCNTHVQLLQHMQHLDLLLQHSRETIATYLLKHLKCTLAIYAFSATSLCCLEEIEAHQHLKFIGVELAGSAERPARGDAMPSSASQLCSAPRHKPLEAPWELNLDPCEERVPVTATIGGRGEAACRHHHHWRGREGIAEESIGEEETPLEGK